MKSNILKILLAGVIVTSCQGPSNKNTDPENVASKRISILQQISDINFNDSTYQAQSAYELNMWLASDGSQTGYYPDNILINSLDSRRTYDLKASVNRFDETIPVPVIKDNIAYVKDSNLIVSAYDLNTGKAIWSRPLTEEKKRNYLMGGGLFWFNDILYCSYGNNEVLALEAKTGEEIWRAKLSSIIRTVPIFGYNKIFVRSLDNKVFVLDAANGTLLYSGDTGIQTLVRASKSATVFYDKGGMIIPNSAGTIDLISHSNGEMIWSANLAFQDNQFRSITMNDISMTPVIKNNEIYASSQTGNLVALNAESGRLIWSDTISGIESIWVSGNGLFAIDEFSNLWHLDILTGHARWKINLIETLGKKYTKKGEFFGPVMANSKLYISTSFGKLLEINAEDGSFARDYDIAIGRSTIPLPINKQIIVMSDRGKMTILGSN